MSALEIKHLFGLRGVSKHDIRMILDNAKQFREILERPVKKVPSLRGMTVVNLFFENSTRTRTSFELAEKRLSADTVNFTSSNSSVKKGETLVDTLRNIEAMKIDIVVVRHKGTGVPKFLADNSNAIIVNAGDGAHEHPTQALLDMLTIEEKLGTLEGKNVTIVGDIRHSRVARSNLWGMTTMGAHVTLCGPSTLVPRNTELMDKVTWESDVKKAVKNADAIIALRLQKERMDDALLPSMREYRNTFGITHDLLENVKDQVLVMHPGPINRGVELDSEIADGENSVILNQVTNGVAVRMAVLYLLAGGRANA
ncbi:MAG: aspartate carbamoyltransferase catalytic subunit [Fibrobacter sp.]|uniref:aspartate carbamoyltransferase catalytic subunit n=1 Tax=unclassified Fibrobacter TaxID=2634177 RepID=UPI000913F354|nr:MULTISPECIES: aspartate carbamoyltransferase catalytic subunit [unclassified Fibrobacter]MBQ3721657.1 aspartate carbamoyltransferase catalytic subunit [Fibrobacter sp.]MBR2059803.1 aspartate carbamoyltransferase catalytic subunit [Fibrobacter sp.]MBR2306667.1 aspartate carbamoyltransferase catalytic subunit [Fibrobacter sp.]MBR4009003.1 aspartate carbamoyltransferase catalytic subunit [Fibrobacter sp.]SHH43714.1 aspartate carbamoyltransferase [Fibrobacter sp. UWCM]